MPLSAVSRQSSKTKARRSYGIRAEAKKIAINRIKASSVNPELRLLSAESPEAFTFAIKNRRLLSRFKSPYKFLTNTTTSAGVPLIELIKSGHGDDAKKILQNVVYGYQG